MCILELQSSLPLCFRLCNLMTIRHRAHNSWFFAFYSVSAHFLSFLRCFRTLSQTQNVKVNISELNSNLPSNFRLYKFIIVRQRELCGSFLKRLCSLLKKNNAKVHISSLSWNFKAIGTRSAVLAWLKKKESEESEEERRTIAGFEHFSDRYVRLVCYTF